ncbi:MAG TPA: hypothetical protein VFE47_21480 [Tepidisphaeraceae bacterium]|nr:hypothetical protein [Tepidisphaeraceae bacterium]
MSRLKLFIVLGFGIMFVAGLEVGRSHTSLTALQADWHRLVARFSRNPSIAPTQPEVKPESGPLLFGKIPISAAQDEQIHKIYHEAHSRTDSLSHQFHEFDRIRDEDIQSMLDPLQLAEYQSIQEERDSRIADLRSQISAEMEKAGKDVRALLTPGQQKQYDEVKRKFDESKDRGHRGGPGNPSHRGAGGPGPHHPHPGPDSGPSPALPPTTAPSVN